MTPLCQSIETLAMAYLDDELADEELRDLELHLLDCAACREHVDAEREALAELRRRLAPPPCPDLVRARVAAALDGEDAETGRASRRARVGAWLLPGVASVAAVAALALFVSAQFPTRTRDPVAIEIAHGRAQALQVAPPRPRAAAPSLPVVDGAGLRAVPGSPYDAWDHPWAAERVAAWRDRPPELGGREVVTQVFRVRTSWGAVVAVKASAFDARGVNLFVGGQRLAGADLWLVTGRGGYAVVHQADDGVGYVFASDDLGPQDLLAVVQQADLVARAGARLGRP